MNARRNRTFGVGMAISLLLAMAAIAENLPWFTMTTVTVSAGPFESREAAEKDKALALQMLRHIDNFHNVPVLHPWGDKRWLARSGDPIITRKDFANPVVIDKRYCIPSGEVFEEMKPAMVDESGMAIMIRRGEPFLIPTGRFRYFLKVVFLHIHHEDRPIKPIIGPLPVSGEEEPTEPNSLIPIKPFNDTVSEEAT